MPTITREMPPASAAPGWIPSRLYRMTVEQYEAMAASGAIPTSHHVHNDSVPGVFAFPACPNDDLADAAGCGDDGIRHGHSRSQTVRGREGSRWS